LKNILIIGGSSGVGDSITKKLGKKYKIISTYRNNFKENQDNIEYKKYDVVENTPDELEIEIPLNSIIYCPGTINLKPFHRYSEQELLNDFRINVTGFIKIFSFFKKNLLIVKMHLLFCFHQSRPKREYLFIHK